MPRPKLFSGPAWVTGIRALSTGGRTTQMSPASRGAGAEGSGPDGPGMQTGLESGSSAAFPRWAHRIIWRRTGPHPGLRNSACGPFLWVLSRGAVGGAILEGACGGSLLVPGAPGSLLCHVGSPGKLHGSPGGQQVSKTKSFRDLRPRVEGKATQPSFSPSSQPPAPFGGEGQESPLGSAYSGF